MEHALAMQRIGCRLVNRADPTSGSFAYCQRLWNDVVVIANITNTWLSYVQYFTHSIKRATTIFGHLMCPTRLSAILCSMYCNAFIPLSTHSPTHSEPTHSDGYH